MKIFIISMISAIIGMSAYSCISKHEPIVSYKVPEKQITPDQQLGQRTFICDSTLNSRDIELAITRDSLRYQIKKNNSLLIISDSLNNKLFLTNYKIEKVRYYLKICDRNTSQVKFLRGWIRRAIE